MPTRLSRLLNNLRALVRGRRDDAELSDELRAYLNAAIDAKVAAGMSRAEAEHAARVELGSATAIRDHVRDVGWNTWIDGVRQDVRYAVRRLIKSPRVSAMVVLTLGIGIGASVAIFTAIDAAILAPLPYAAPSRLVEITHRFAAMGDRNVAMSPPEYQDYRDRARAFASIAAYERATMDVSTAGETRPIEVLRATPDLTTVLGVSPALGRAFTAADSAIDAPPVVLLSFRSWTIDYGARADVLGQTIQLNGVAYTIVGVLPRSVEFPSGAVGGQTVPRLWLPLSFTPRELADRAASTGTHVVARLAPEMSLEQARADVEHVAAAFQREHDDVYRGTLRLTAAVDRFELEGVRDMAPTLLVLGVAIGLMLITACANVSGLLLVRTIGRRPEIAIRLALGGARRRVLRQLLTETLMLGAIGGLIGWVASALLGAVAARVAPDWSDALMPSGSMTIAFTVGLSLLVGLASGLGPALRLTRVGVVDQLTRAMFSRATRVRGGQRRFVIVQIATTLVLLVSAALLGHSFVRVLNVPLGFDPQDVVVARTTFSQERYPDSARRRVAERTIAERLRTLPNVRAVGLTTHLPILDQRMIGYAIERAGSDQIHWGTNALVSPEYFSVMAIPVVRGRTFTDADRAATPMVAVINEIMAHMYWPNRDPIGERVLWGGRRMTVVGIVGDVHVTAWDAQILPALYGSIFQVESGAAASASFVLRTGHGTHTTAAAVTGAMRAIDGGLPGPDVEPMTQIVQHSLDERRLMLATLSTFAIVALLLAGIGLHGLLAHAVALRTREFGVRLALGARPADVVAMVMRDGLFVSSAGLASGLLLSFALVRGLGTQLFGVGPIDAPAFAIAVVLLLGVSLATTYVVARRATRVDPVVALRAE